MSREQPLTSPEAINDVVERYAVTEAQAHLLITKTAVAKLVATVADDEMFVLKGGTLLHHVHGSPRVSLADIDYADGRKEVSADVAAVKETREEYAQRKLNEPADLRRYWSREPRMNGLRKKWPDELGSELILDLEEIERQSESLADFDVAFKLAIECFGGVFDRL